jgi:hypothetical protein
MAAATIASVLQQLRTIAGAKAYEERSDPELLELFLAQHEEAAFATLVKRHGPMVLKVCRRIQGNVLGRVLDLDGKPVPSAKAHYQQERGLLSPPGFHYNPVSGSADTEGRFRLSVSIHGRNPIRPFNPIGTLTAVAPGFAPAAIHLGAPENFKDFPIHLVKDDVPIQGRLIDLQAKPGKVGQGWPVPPRRNRPWSQGGCTHLPDQQAAQQQRLWCSGFRPAHAQARRNP